eukprot:TRINITY_DN648_c0_g4_i1.p7 TRINITY_DN648_c0_g4~~TRINITY_DN648_c0_g4_i1.p7  ORF type:complete len:110 (-),score=41.44 TRINITY_DN648_c0_g4_i1:1535-1864(-)
MNEHNNRFWKMEADEDREKKQNYLRDNIMDKGYDTDKFITFLINLKGTAHWHNIEDGANIDVWTFDELGEMVERFTSMGEEGLKTIKKDEKKVLDKKSKKVVEAVNIGN